MRVPLDPVYGYYNYARQIILYFCRIYNIILNITSQKPKVISRSSPRISFLRTRICLQIYFDPKSYSELWLFKFISTQSSDPTSVQPRPRFSCSSSLLLCSTAYIAFTRLLLTRSIRHIGYHADWHAIPTLFSAPPISLVRFHQDLRW